MAMFPLIQSKAASEEYKENFDKIFGKKEETSDCKCILPQWNEEAGEFFQIRRCACGCGKTQRRDVSLPYKIWEDIV